MAKVTDNPPARTSARRDTDGAQVAGVLALTEKLLAAPNSAAAAALLLSCVVEMYAAPRAALLADRDGRLPILASHGLDASGPFAACRGGAARRVFEAGTTQPLRGLDPAQEPWLAQLFPAGADLVLVRLVADTRDVPDEASGAPEPCGVLLLQLPALQGPRWRSVALAPLERAAASTAHALRTLWRMEQLERLAATDGLTKIPNRRTFDAALERELARGARSGEPVSLVILDIDHFSRVNNEHGHPAGDKALRNVAAALSIACRDVDTAARYGGEEFAVILPDCGPEQCAVIADRLREAVASAPAVTSLTASAGFASCPLDAADAETLVKVADDALLLSKNNGRDRATRGTRATAEGLRRAGLASRVGAQPPPVSRTQPVSRTPPVHADET